MFNQGFVFPTASSALSPWVCPGPGSSLLTPLGAPGCMCLGGEGRPDRTPSSSTLRDPVQTEDGTPCSNIIRIFQDVEGRTLTQGRALCRAGGRPRQRARSSEGFLSLFEANAQNSAFVDGPLHYPPHTHTWYVLVSQAQILGMYTYVCKHTTVASHEGQHSLHRGG